MLPTDDRFLKLSDEQKQYLFVGFLELAPDNELRAAYHAEFAPRNKEELGESKGHFQGYTEEEIEWFEEQWRIAEASSAMPEPED